MGEIEIWKDIPNYEGLYQASNLGSIRSVDRKRARDRRRTLAFCRGQTITQFSTSNGRQILNLSKDGKSKTYAVHFLVALSFLGERPSGFHIHHINGNYSDNRSSNLCYMESGPHIAMHLYGTKRTAGSRNGKAVLSEDKVRQIRSMHQTGMYFHREIAEMFGVSKTIITRIVNRQIWKDV